MSKRVVIASDSTTDLGPGLIGRYGIETLPLGIVLGDKQYLDGIDVDSEFIYAHYAATGELPKTSAVNVSDFTAFFERRRGSAVVMFTISSHMSSTYGNACLAAEGFEDVHVVDTLSLSTGGGLLVAAAAEMAKSGVPAAEIAAACRELAGRVDASFVIDDLEFLHKGGRCSALTAIGANLLQIKPGIVVREGRMSVGAKYRGKFQNVLKKYIRERLSDPSAIDLDRAFVTHAGCDEELCRQCVEQVKELAPFKEVLLTRAGCTISSHCGRNTLGVLFLRKSKVE